MINKVLIFGRYSQNMNVGGPMGFYAQNLQGHKGKYFDTTDYYISYPKWYLYLRKFVGAKLLKPEWLVRKDIAIANIPPLLPFRPWLIETILTFKYAKANQYKIIYFHDLYSYSVVKHLIHPSQTVIFQPHSPEHISEETKYFSNDKVVFDWCKQIEREAFSEIQHFVFPHQGAVEIYKDLLSEQSKTHFVLSGCKPKIAVNPKSLDSTTINLLFIGRRNHIKGFDLILQAFKQAYKNNNNLRLYLLGNREREEESDGIIDIGFSTEPENWIAGCDYLLNINRQSYFDLILMETLSVGTPVVLHPNQGHSFFLEHPNKGIELLKDLNLETLTKTLVSLPKPTESDRESNRKFYTQYFTDDLYRKRVDDFCRAILDEN